MSGAPIGVFDSGVGGLSVLRAIRAELPGEELLYFADTAHVPYGSKPDAYIQARAVAISEFLVGRGVKAIVVACNTATAAAAPLLRERYAVPVVAVEPAVKPAAAYTRSGIIGVLATAGTLRSTRFSGLIRRVAADRRVVTQACPGLVEQVEAGELASLKTRRLVARYLEPLLAAGADAIVLGCTHYPLLRPLIEELAGPAVAVIDSGHAVARFLCHRLADAGLANGAAAAGGERFFTSGPRTAFERSLALLWREGVTARTVPDSPAPGPAARPGASRASAPVTDE